MLHFDSVRAGAAPPAPVRPPRRCPDLRRLLATLALALAAVLGNYINLSLYFGVEVLFGSIAALIAIARLGTWPGLAVAMAGGAYTLVLWHHPYALIIFTAEAAAIAWHRARARRRDRPVPPLAVSAALYWLLLGMPLVLLLYHGVLHMDWPATLLIAAKQALNGILNAALAGGLLVGVTLLQGRRDALALDKLLFSLLLAGPLLPSLLITAWENTGFKDHLETDAAGELRLFGAVAERSLAQAAAAGPEALAAELKSLERLLAQRLPPAAAPRLFLIRRDTGAPVLGDGPPAGRLTATGELDLEVIMPSGHQPSAMARWRAARYRLTVPAERTGPALEMIIEISTTPIIDALHRHVSRLLAVLLLLGLGTVVLARRLSRNIATPLLRLADTARALPDTIRTHRDLQTPPPGLFAESVRLRDAITAMAASLNDSFQMLQSERDEQVRQRALLDLEAHTLAGLVHHGDDATAFAEDLCRQVRTVLPAHLCVLLLPGAGDRLRAAAAPGLAAPGRGELDRLLASPQAEAFLHEVLAAGTPTALPAALVDAGWALPAAFRGGQAIPVRDHDGHGLGLLLTDIPLRERSAFAGEVLDTAATLAGLGLASIHLRRHHRVLLDALSQSGTGIVVAMRNGRDHLVTFANRGFEELTGYSAEEVLGRDLRILRDEDAAQPDLARLRDAVAADQHCRVVVRNRRPDGSGYWCALALSPVHGDGGAVTHYIGVQQDVTEAVEAMERLRVSEARLTEAQAIAHVGSWEMDLTTRVLSLSDETYRLLGYRPGEMPATPERLLAAVHPDDRDKVRAEMTAALERPSGDFRAEFRVLGADGGERIQLARGRIYFDADGRPRRFAGTALDVTQQRRTEEALRAQQERYRLVVENLEDLVVRVDLEGRFQFVSPSYCRTFGRSEADLIGHAYMPLVHPDDRAATAAAMAGLFDPPYAVTMEQRAETVHGWRWLQWSDTAVLDEDGKVVGIVGVGRDITERKRAEQALRASEQRFRTLFETIGEGVLYYDGDGVVSDVNPAAAQLLGAPREALVGSDIEARPWRLLRDDGTPLPLDDHPSRVALRTGRDTEPVVLGLAAGDDVRWLWVRAHAESAPGADRPHQVFVTLADITRLHRTQQRLQAIIDSSPHGIVEMDMNDRRLLWCNDAMLNLFDYRRDELLGLHAGDLHPTDMEPELVADLGEAAEDTDGGSLSVPLYVPCRRRDGTLFYCKIAPGLMRLGQTRTLTAFFTDVTLEYRSRRALVDSAQALLDAQALAHIGSWDYDIAADRAVWSPEVYRIFDQDAATFDGSFESFLSTIHPDDRNALLHAYGAARDGGAETYDFIHRLLLAGGRVKWIHERAEFERDGEGRALRMRGTVQDITERKLAELRVVRREAMVSELLALAADFVDAGDGDIERTCEGALSRIGAFIGADRAYLFEHDAAAGTITNTLEWTADGIRPAIDENQDLPLAELPALAPRLESAEAVAISRVADLPDEWARERALFGGQEIQALLLAPLLSDGAMQGFIGFDVVRAQRTWTDVEIHFLQVFANILASARKRARALAALRIATARYEEVSRQSRTMAWEIDAGGRYTYVDAASLEVVGEPPQALIGRRCIDLLAPDATDAQRRAEWLLATREPIKDFVKPCRRNDGSIVWLLSNAVPLFDEQGTWRGYRGTDKDITAHHLAQQQLKESKEQLSAIFDNAPIGMALLDAERRLLMVNRALADLVGRGRAALEGTSEDSILHPDDLPAAVARFRDLLAGRRDSYRMTKRYRHPDGREVWGDMRMVLLPTAPDAPPAPLAMVEDVTELHSARERRRVLEDTLATYTARLEELLNLVNLSPPEQQVLALLRLGCRALGMTAATLELLRPNGRTAVIARSYDDLPQRPPAVPAALLDQALARPGRPVSCKDVEPAPEAPAHGFGCCIALAIAGSNPPGDEHLLLVLRGPQDCIELNDPLRQLLRLIAQRITALRLQEDMQRDLVRAKERETIGHLASGVAHDFNNLLGVIDANLFYVEATLGDLDEDDPELGQVLEETRSALSQAKVVTSGMLSLSRAGGVPLAAVGLTDTIGELIAILRHVLPDAIALETDVPPALEAWTNSAFLQSALLNLAFNARDAMPEGGRLRIAAAPLRCDADPVLAVGRLPAAECVEVSVSDTGGGIPAEAMGRIFEPLFSTKAKRRGHGLGLFMVKEFVLRSGAGLAVNTEPDRGSRFRLLLPAEPPRLAGRGAAVAEPAAADGGDPDAAPLTGLRVLVVDDDPRVRDAVARLLTLEGVETALAEHGQAGLERLRDDPRFDLVLTDIAMPVLDGLALRKRMRAERPELPVMLMTGQDGALKTAEDSGAELPPLRKPVEPAALREAIRTLCRRGQ